MFFLPEKSNTTHYKITADESDLDVAENRCGARQYPLGCSSLFESLAELIMEFSIKISLPELPCLLPFLLCGFWSDLARFQRVLSSIDFLMRIRRIVSNFNFFHDFARPQVSTFHDFARPLSTGI